VGEEIAIFNPIKPALENIDVAKGENQTIDPSNNIFVSPETTNAEDKVIKKTSKKRRRSSKSQKSQPKSKRNRSGNVVTFTEEERRQYAAEVKKDFELDKKKVLDSLDKSYKKLFGKIAFCKWKKDPYRPVVVLSPFSVPPALRPTWETMVKNTRGDRKRMWYYTFWYGSPLEEGYTQTKQKELVMYEEGEKRGLHHLDKKIQAKMEKGKKLSRVEEQAVQGYKELEIELKKKPSQRRPEIFQEYHDAILELDDSVSLPDEENVDAQKSDQDHDGTSDSDELASEAEEDSAGIQAKVGKKNSKPLKKRQKTFQGNELNQKNETDVPKGRKNNKDSKKAKSKKSKELELEKNENKNSDDSSNNGVLVNQEIATEVVEDDDEDYDEIGGKRRNKSLERKRKTKKVQKKLPEKNENLTKFKEEPIDPDQELKLRKRRDAQVLGRRRSEERDAYKKCRELFKPLTEEFREAIDKKDVRKGVKCMREIKKRNVSKLTAPFMEETKLPILVKNAKHMVSDERDKKLRKDLYDELRKVYDEKKQHVPEGWRKLPRSAAKAESVKMEKELIKSDRKKKNLSDNDFTPQERQVSSNEQKESMDEPIAKRANDQFVGDSSNHLSSEIDEIIKIPKVQQTIERQKSEPSTSSPINKVAKKKIPSTSLRSLLSKDTKPKEKAQEAPHARKSLSLDEAVSKKLPNWLTFDLSIDSLVKSDNSRKLGLEFLNQVTQLFPKIVKPGNIAIALEQALHDWTIVQGPGKQLKEIYWGKLHKIAGALSGKQNHGSLIDDILKGEYKSAMALIKLSDDVLIASYEGRENII